MRVPIDIKQLSVAEKLDLLHLIWESLPKVVASPPLSRADKRLLDARLKELRKDPEGGVSWEVVRERLFRGKRRRP